MSEEQRGTSSAPQELADVEVAHLGEILRVDALGLQVADHLVADDLQLLLLLDDLLANIRASFALVSLSVWIERRESR